MKVILLSGSPNLKGNTMYALRHTAAAIEAEGVETQIFSLHGMDIHACIACNLCGKQDRCVHDDGFNEIVAAIREADGFIVGSPVYFGTARGDVMNFLQRLGMQHKKQGNFMEGKVGGTIAVARRGGHTATLQELQMFFGICNVTVPGANYWNMIQAHHIGDAAQDSEGLENLTDFGRNVARTIKERHA